MDCQMNTSGVTGKEMKTGHLHISDTNHSTIYRHRHSKSQSWHQIVRCCTETTSCWNLSVFATKKEPKTKLDLQPSFAVKMQKRASGHFWSVAFYDLCQLKDTEPMFLIRDDLGITRSGCLIPRMFNICTPLGIEFHVGNCQTLCHSFVLVAWYGFSYQNNPR